MCKDASVALCTNAHHLKHPNSTEIVGFQPTGAFCGCRIVDIRKIVAHDDASNTDSGSPMLKIPSSTVRSQQRRQRKRAAGMEEVLIEMPTEIREFIDQLKERRQLRNRSQALLHLVELGRQATRQIA